MALTADILAEIKDYDSLVLALRWRATELNLALSSISLGQVAGLPDRYLTKILGPPTGDPQTRRSLGPISLGPALGVLGVKLLLVHDEAAAERVKGRLVPAGNGVRKKATLANAARIAHLRAIAPKGGVKRAEKLTAKRRSEIACKANADRWRKAHKRRLARLAKSVPPSAD